MVHARSYQTFVSGNKHAEGQRYKVVTSLVKLFDGFAEDGSFKLRVVNAEASKSIAASWPSRGATQEARHEMA